jgi:hypothetical protein
MPDLSRFAIYRSSPSQPKRAEEADVIMPFLLRLEHLTTLEDVEFGEDPPDFLFRHGGKRIGVELTDLVPRCSGKGGHAQREHFKAWETEAKTNRPARAEFPWDDFTLRESLAAFASQLERKTRKVKKWKGQFSEKWLLAHVGPGSPFGGLVASKRQALPGQELAVADYYAKTAHAVFATCQRPHPFSYVILFSGSALLAFPASGTNPYNLPTTSPDVLARGAAASDTFLDSRSRNKSIVEHFPTGSDAKSKPPTS